jgi:hypothetical protein
MGRRGPKPQPDWLKFLRGNPHGHRLFLDDRIPTRAEIMAMASDSSPLGWLSRPHRPSRDRPAAAAVKAFVLDDDRRKRLAVREE